MRALFPLALTAVVVAVVGATGCNQQRIFMREKVSERYSPPMPAIQTDRFVYGKPYGQVDVLFVVDNTESFEAGKDSWRTAYESFLSRMETSADAHQLDFRVQVVTTPGGLTPKNYFGSGLSTQPHMDDLYVGGLNEFGVEIGPILDGEDRGYMDPYTSTTIGLAHKAFAGRDFVPLFLVYAMGDDMDESLDTPEAPTSIQTALDEKRGMYQSHVTLLTRGSWDEPGEDVFPYCDTFSPATLAQQDLEAVQWRSRTNVDLCDSTWPTFEEALFNQIIEFKKRLVLSHPPHGPESMLLRAAAHVFRYGDDFTFDATTNEIVFLRDLGLIEGDLIEVAYFLKPSSPVLGGTETPGASMPMPEGWE